MARALCSAAVPPCRPHSFPAAGGLQISSSLGKNHGLHRFTRRFLTAGEEERVKQVFVCRAALASLFAPGAGAEWVPQRAEQRVHADFM